jgi:hypothetical protein
VDDEREFLRGPTLTATMYYGDRFLRLAKEHQHHGAHLEATHNKKAETIFFSQR